MTPDETFRLGGKGIVLWMRGNKQLIPKRSSQKTLLGDQFSLLTTANNRITIACSQRSTKLSAIKNSSNPLLPFVSNRRRRTALNKTNISLFSVSNAENVVGARRTKGKKMYCLNPGNVLAIIYTEN